MLRLTAELHEKIRLHGARSYPYEGCGLLLGQVDDGVNVVTAIRPLPNIWPNEEERRVRFRIAEDDWRDVEMEAMLEGLEEGESIISSTYDNFGDVEKLILNE